MRLTVIGCGDAFGSGGRANTCFWVRAAETTICLDFGATALVGLRQQGLDPNGVDAVVLSHLHGDHFGGLPMLLLDAQFDGRRDRPLTVIGPVGTRDRLKAALEVFYPGSSGNRWRFPLEVRDLPCRVPDRFGDLAIETWEVAHPSGAPSTAVRLSGGRRVLAYSGDTAWTEALTEAADRADLLILECNGFDRVVPHHLSFSTIEAERERLNARRILLTHLGPAALGHIADMEARGYEVAHDGLGIEL